MSGVRWFEWSDAAFKKAREEDKPVVLDLTASWSYGCRTMDRETYGNPEVALLLNRDYVPVRVDCDRRPDIDDRYNLGGWPTTAFLTPAAELLGGTTYVALDAMKQLLVQLKVGYAANRDKIAEEIASRDRKIREVLASQLKGTVPLTIDIFRKTVRGIVATHDPLHGGFGQAPKFPLTGSLRVVLQAYQEIQGPDFGHVLQKTLDAMSERGLYDHERGGFFHYVVNDVWSSARFEKLADLNAHLIRLYLDASTVLGSEKYRAKALHALEWARTTLLDPERGVFYHSQAADDDYYAASPEQRARLVPPPVDRTIYIPSSAAMASAFLRAAQVTGAPDRAAEALRGLDWILARCVDGRGVAHYHDGEPRLFTLARDPIALASALLDAHDHSGRKPYLDAAESMMEDLLRRFWSNGEKGIVDREVDAPDRGDLARPRKNMAENALAAENFGRLWRITGEDRHRRCAEKILLSYPDLLDGYGHETAEYALAADWLVRPPQEAKAENLAAYLPRRKVVR